MRLSVLNSEAVDEELAVSCIRALGKGNLATVTALVDLAEEADCERSSSGEHLILEFFSPTYLFNLVLFSPTCPPQNLLEKLRTAISARREGQEMLSSTCKKYFKELVTSRIFYAGGIAKEEEGSILS